MSSFSILVYTHGNIEEWNNTRVSSEHRPRLPLPYAFGEALRSVGVRVIALDRASDDPASADTTSVFSKVYRNREREDAFLGADFAALWGTDGVRAALRKRLRGREGARVVLCSYVWTTPPAISWRNRFQATLVKLAARNAAAVVVMTDEHAQAARRQVPTTVPVVRLRVGIDTRFYRQASSIADLSHGDRQRVEPLLARGYVVMLGDELRLDSDALILSERYNVPLIRVAQYRQKSQAHRLAEEAKRRGIGDTLVVLEGISHRALRFVLQNARAYAGLVDASWQPAGWTVACECLASGLPLVLYDGITARELRSLGLMPDIMTSVPMRNVERFAAAVSDIRQSDNTRRNRAQAFAETELDLLTTGRAFANDLLSVLR